MPRYGRALGMGLLLGGAAGLLLGAAERYGRRAPQQLIDWDLAVDVALRTCGRAPLLEPAERAGLEQQYRAVLERIEAPIAAYTRTRLPLPQTVVAVLDRPAWIRANARSFQRLLQPLEEAYRQRVCREPAGPAALAGMSRLALSGQLGLLLGYLARRVLGQYDINLLGREPLEAGRLYFVEPNIRTLVAMLRLPLTEFRTWIALHEATHAHEFELHPWVREYLNAALQAYLRTLVEELADGHPPGVPLAQWVARLVEALRDRRNLLESFMTAEQRALVSRLQVLMALLEGYSNHVMHEVGRGLLPHFAEIEDRLAARQQQRAPLERWLLQVTGLNLKLEQYALGEAFVRAVVAARGIEFLNRVWEGPAALPSAAELRAPATWIARLEAAA